MRSLPLDGPIKKNVHGNPPILPLRVIICGWQNGLILIASGVKLKMVFSAEEEGKKYMKQSLYYIAQHF